MSDEKFFRDQGYTVIPSCYGGFMAVSPSVVATYDDETLRRMVREKWRAHAAQFKRKDE